jgi:tRNA(Leu) C34 or U34 (ribose-2'-O)-methylase TrmL
MADEECHPMRKVDAPGYAAIGLHNPRNPLNVGAALRAASCFGVSLVALTGRSYKVQRTDTARTHLRIPILHTENLRDVIPYGCVPVAVERRPGALSLPDYSHPDRAFYIFGPEDGTLGPDILDWCRDVVEIPSLYSLNLAAAVNVALYDRTAKSLRR